MIKNYLRVAWRNLFRNKLYSIITIVGLVIGMGSCMLIYLFVNHELSFDTFHKNANDIYRMTLHIHQPQGEIESAATSPRMGPLIEENFPEILKTARLSYPLEKRFTYKDKTIYDNTIMSADSTVFDVFSFELLEGNARSALNAPNQIVLGEAMAKKFFGNEPALGKTMGYTDDTQVTVSAVVKDLPANSHFKFDALVSRPTLLNYKDTMWMMTKEDNWYWIFQYTYFLVDKKADIAALEKKISKLTESQEPERKKIGGIWYSAKLQPLKDIHLHSAMDREIQPNGDIKYIYIFSGTAILIMLIACFNFINLSTARSLSRSREIGVRKVVGAGRFQLIGQFLGESLLFTLIAGAFTLLLLNMVIAPFNTFADTHVTLDPRSFLSFAVLLGAVGILSGLYPALLISSFKPVKALKGRIKHSLQDILVRKGLVIFQFSIAVFLVIGTQVIMRQLSFIQNRKIGVQKEQILRFRFRNVNEEKKERFIRELKDKPGVLDASLTTFSFKEQMAIPLMLTDEGEQLKGFTAYPVILIDESFLSTFQIPLVTGRNLSKDHPEDRNESYLINETAVKEFGWKTPQASLGKHINWAGEKNGKVVGVIKDFNYASAHETIKPLILLYYPGTSWTAVRIKNTGVPETIQSIEQKWQAEFQDVPFQYSFMQEDFDKVYRSEQKLAEILGAFTVLSIVVACLGLFGLASYSIKQRAREISIRRVLGATVASLMKLVSRDFILLVLIAICIAVPVGWYAAHVWLLDFAYKTDLSWLIFLGAGVMAIAVAWLTISAQAFRTAASNPVKNLRAE